MCLEVLKLKEKKNHRIIFSQIYFSLVCTIRNMSIPIAKHSLLATSLWNVAFKKVLSISHWNHLACSSYGNLTVLSKIRMSFNTCFVPLTSVLSPNISVPASLHFSLDYKYKSTHILSIEFNSEPLQCFQRATRSSNNSLSKFHIESWTQVSSRKPGIYNPVRQSQCWWNREV